MRNDDKDADNLSELVRLLETSPAAFIVYDLDGNMIYVNQKTLDLYGYSLEELKHTKLPTVNQLKAKGETSFEVHHRRKDGKTICLLISAKIGQWDGKAVVLSIATDITQQKLVEQEKTAQIVENAAEQARTETELRRSEEQFHSLVKNIPDVVWTSDETGKTTFVSDGVKKVFGFSPEEIMADANLWFGRIHSEDVVGVKKAYEELIQQEHLFDIEYRVQRKDGAWIWIHDRASTTYVINGIRYADGLFRDITDRKRGEEELRKYRDHLEDLVKERTRELAIKNKELAEEIAERTKAELSLRESEARLKDAQALGRMGNWEFDIPTQKISWSDQTYRLYDRDPALGPPTPEEEVKYYTADQVAKIREYGHLAMQNGKTFHYDVEAHLPSGKSKIFFVTMQPIKDAKGKVVKLFGTVQDITESRRTEERLKQINQFLDLIIENIPLIITVKDARKLTYQRVNRTFALQAKMDPQMMVGKTADELFSPAEAKGITANDQRVIKSKAISVLEGRETRTGRIFRTKKIPLLDEKGAVVYLLSIADDVTEQTKIEQERKALLEEALKVSDVKSNLLSQAAHELKTPLTIIMGWAELLFNAKKQGKSLDATFDLEDIETILRNAERLNDLIDDFLDVGRIEKGKFELSKQSIDFNEIIENATRAVTYLAVQKSITLAREITPSGPILVDRRRMEQVLINLLSNAIKYSPEHTSVAVKSNPVEINGRKMLRVEVVDKGFGFTTQELAEAMTPFGKVYTQQEQKRAVQGTGLGLFISRQIVEQHGGTLILRSEGANKGTQVEILLPASE